MIDGLPVRHATMFAPAKRLDSPSALRRLLNWFAQSKASPEVSACEMIERSEPYDFRVSQTILAPAWHLLQPLLTR